MAYMSQERKAQIAPKLKEICKRYGVKATVAVRHHSTLVLNIKSGNIDFIGNYNQVCGREARDHIQVNPYWFQDHFEGSAKYFLKEIFATMNEGNHDNSDPMTDYYDVGWYVDVNIGQWNKPYTLEK